MLLPEVERLAWLPPFKRIFFLLCELDYRREALWASWGILLSWFLISVLRIAFDGDGDNFLSREDGLPDST